MAAKKSAKKAKRGARKSAKVGNLAPRSLGGDDARSVKGGLAVSFKRDLS